MDPLSITITYIGLLGTVTKLSTTIHGFVRDVRNIRGNLDTVSGELHSLRIVLEILSEDTTNSELPESLKINLWYSCELWRCFSRYREYIEKYSGGGIRKGVKWSLSGRDNINKLHSSLKAHKSALDIAWDMLAL
jgi:hypothetical protein